MSTRFLEALRSGRVILMDGAMGTELMNRGLDPTIEHAHAWNVSHPQEVQEVHSAYLDAGAACLLTNTFLTHKHVPDRNENYRAAVKLAISAGHESQFILLDIGPGTLALNTAYTIGSSAPTICAALLLETQIGLGLISAFVEQSPSFPGAPCLVSFAFAREAGSLLCLHDKASPESVAEFVHQHRMRFVALGVNCGREMGMDDIIEVVRRFRKVTDLPILARPNAGTPTRLGKRWVYPHSPESMAARLPELIDAGATLIGGCCGTTPAHIAAFKEVIDRLGVGWKSK